MSKLSLARRLSPGYTIAGVIAAVLAGGWCLTPDVHSQAPATNTANPAMVALLGKLKAQQALIVANQTKIEAQTALLKEEVRQAKIYSARSGSGHR